MNKIYKQITISDDDINNIIDDKFKFLKNNLKLNYYTISEEFRSGVIVNNNEFLDNLKNNSKIYNILPEIKKGQIISQINITNNDIIDKLKVYLDGKNMNVNEINKLFDDVIREVNDKLRIKSSEIITLGDDDINNIITDFLQKSFNLFENQNANKIYTKLFNYSNSQYDDVEKESEKNIIKNYIYNLFIDEYNNVTISNNNNDDINIVIDEFIDFCDLKLKMNINKNK